VSMERSPSVDFQTPLVCRCRTRIDWFLSRFLNPDFCLWATALVSTHHRSLRHRKNTRIIELLLGRFEGAIVCERKVVQIGALLIFDFTGPCARPSHFLGHLELTSSSHHFDHASTFDPLPSRPKVSAGLGCRLYLGGSLHYHLITTPNYFHPMPLPRASLRRPEDFILPPAGRPTKTTRSICNLPEK
jgi:hypothetical protein